MVTSADPIPFQIYQGHTQQRMDLRTTHEEADVILVQQMVKFAESGSIRINLLSDDTDVFILLVHYYVQEQLICELMMSGTSSGRSVIDIKATSEKHRALAHQLLPLHVQSGCDTVSQMFGIGKGKALKTIGNYKYSLEKLGDSNIPFDQVLEETTQFVIACYGSREQNMSSARYGIWTTKMANKKRKSTPILKVLPLTTEAFELHVRRAHFQAAIWRSVLEPDPPALSPMYYGWTLDESKQLLRSVPLPDDVSPAPMDVLQLIRCGCSSDMPCMTARCSWYAARLSCSMFCGCHADYNCHNEHSVAGVAQVEQDVADDGNDPQDGVDDEDDDDEDDDDDDNQDDESVYNECDC